MKLAERNHVGVEVGSFASSDKVSPTEDDSYQPQNAVPQPFPNDLAGDHVSSWILVTSYHKRNRCLAGGRVKPSSRKVNHRFTKRIAFPPMRGQDNDRRNDPVFPSSRKEDLKAIAKVGRQQARSGVKLPPAERTFFGKPLTLLACAVAETPLQVKVIAVPPGATKLKVASLLAPSPAVVMAHPSALPADRVLQEAASLTLPASPVQNCCLPTPLVATTTSSQGGKVPFVSLWRLVYGMLFAMLLQLDLCGAAAAVAAVVTPSPPPPRHTLGKEARGAGAVAKVLPAASQMRPAEQPRLRGHTEMNNAHTSNHAALSNFQNASANSTSYSWQLTSAPSGSYESIACSEDGQHVVAGNYHGFLFTSNDYGATWNQSLPVLGYYLDIASSSDGQYWTVASYSVGIYTSSDYGNSWSLSSAAPIGWYSIASSGNGQYLSATTYYGSIYTSNDYGHTWHATSAGMANWRAIDCSESGHFLAAVAWNFGVYTSSDYGVTWMLAPLPPFLLYFNVPAITVSRTGQYLALLSDDSLYTSSNYGYSWTQLVPYTYWKYFSASGRGHYLAGSNEGVEFSEDYGANWVALSAPNFALNDAALTADGLSGYGFDSGAIYRMSRLNETIVPVAPGPNQWQATSAPSALYRSLACSDSGQYVVAGANEGYLYTSNDFGVTWHISLATFGYYFGVASSSSGQYWAATSDNAGIYTSSDYGQSWSLTSAPSSEWSSIASSRSGQRLFAVPSYGSIYASNDYGQTWYIAKEASVNWGTISSSANGQYLAAVSTSYGLYMSSDYGATWLISFSGSPFWYSVTISSTGQHVAAIGDGKLYTSSDYGVSWNITSPLNMFWFFLTSSGTGQYLAGSYEGGFYSSDDHGATWISLSASHLSFVKAALSGNGQYAFGYKNGAIYRVTLQNDTTLPASSEPPTTEPTAATTAISTNGQSNTCPAGTYNMKSGQPISLCAICPGGTYSTEGMNSCLSCPAGSFSSAWSSSCTECPAGFYCLFGASTAVMCPSGTISNAGASFCTACPVGQYSSPGSSTCLTCTSA